MIQIDDAGSGSLIGGTCIGAIRIEDNNYTYSFIPVTYYREKPFSTKKYLDKCNDIVFMLLDRLNVGEDEPIYICQGYMFDKVRKAMESRNILYHNSKIGNPLQNKIEETFKDYALKLGLPKQYVKYTKYPLHFHRILRWVYADYEKRYKLCKTGWKSWKKYGNIQVETYFDILYSNNYTCLKCGIPIKKGTRVKVLKYISNCPNIIYLHSKC